MRACARGRFLAACAAIERDKEDSLTSVARKSARAALLSLSVFAVLAFTLASAAWAQGNSGAAHACQHGGFNSLVGAEGQTFDNVGACVSYAGHGGAFASGIIIPKGHTATLTKAKLFGFDPLIYGYQLNFGANVEVGSQEAGGLNQKTPDATLGPFSTAELLRIWLIDNFGPEFGGCPSFTFYSDGLHGFVSGSNPFLVEIADGFFCLSPPTEPRHVNNLEVTVTVN